VSRFTVGSLALLALCLGYVTAPAGAAASATAFADEVSDDSSQTDIGFAAVYPNPVTEDDRGEFVVLQVPPGTALGDYSLSDGEDSIPLPNRTVGGRLALTGDPGLVRNYTNATVVALRASLSLANGGERLALERGDRTLATGRYRDAPEGELGRFDDRGAVSWRPLGRTDRPVVTARGGSVRAFVLPDSPGVSLDVLRDADQRILLAGYTFASERVTDALVAAAQRGVDVRVLLEGDPVDGITTREARLLDHLAANGVAVRLLGGPRSRYAYHHAKYAVADDRAVVLTENWKPAGTGGHSSRGWGAVVTQRSVVEGLAETFRADASWAGATRWSQFRRGRSFSRSDRANATFPGEFDAKRLPVERTRLLVTPDNAGRAVTGALDNATESIDVVQMTIDGPDQRFLRATVRAARRGVDVRVLLGGAWYVEEENRRLVDHLREIAQREGLPLEAKLADSEAFEKIHAKGAVVDGDEVLVGSLNWNGESIRSNREVVLSLEGERVGTYYQRVFDADWRGRSESRSLPLPLELLAAIAGVVALAGLVAWRIDFDAGNDVGVGP
jgi:phosphatidylserine/phosphatidylglycerophosphate/cardiolipin synthase-like enzyme